MRDIMKTFNVIHQTIFSLILFLGMLSLEANDPSDQQFEYNNLEDRWLLLEDNLEWMYFHKNHVYDFQDSVWRPYTYQYYQISNSAELTIEGVSQTVSFSSSGQPISVFNVNEEYNDQIPDVIPSTEGLSSIFRPEGQILEVQSQGGYFYFHNEDTAYSYPNNSWVTYSYEYFPSSGSAFLYLGAQPEVVEFEDGIPVSGLIVPDSNLLSSFVLPDVSGVYDPHENPFPDSVEINHSSVTAFVGSGDSALFYSFSLEAKQRVFITAESSFNDYITPVLLDPKIKLLNANGDIIVENDDWNTSAQQNFSELNLRINDPTTSTSLDSLESALLLDLEQGSYTLVMSPLEGTQEGKGVLSVSAFGISKIGIRAKGAMGNLNHGITLSELSSQTRILASAKGARFTFPKIWNNQWDDRSFYQHFSGGLCRYHCRE
jgi:hypothetical protein